MTPIAVAHIRPKCGDLHLYSIARNQNHAKLRTHCHTFRKERHHLLGSRIGRHIVIGRLVPEQQVAHTSTYQQRLIPSAEECLANRIGHFPRRHGVIMRQKEP